MNTDQAPNDNRRSLHNRHSTARLVAVLLLAAFLTVGRPVSGRAADPPWAGPPTYSTFLGGSSWEEGHGLAVDEQGAVYVVGRTASPDFPTTAGAFDTTGGSIDAFVVKFAPGGERLEYATLLGGSGDDSAYAVAVEGGIAYIVGETWSTNFPSTPGSSGESDAFVVALNETGSGVLYATLLGGSDEDAGYGIAVEDGSAYVAGITYSEDAQQGDAFVARLDEGGGVVYNTSLAGSDVDAGFAVAVRAGEAYVAGETSSRNFPASGYRGNRDAFLVRLTTSGSLSSATLLGGTGDESALGVVLDETGEAYITGWTDSADLPLAGGSYSGGGDAFVAAVSPAGALDWAAYLGGSGADEGQGIAVDASGKLHLAGVTGSADFPVTAGAYQGQLGGGRDAFLLSLEPIAGGVPALAYATYLGGLGNDAGLSLAPNRQGAPSVTGSTRSADFPTSAVTLDGELMGTQDGFVSAWTAGGPALTATPVPTAAPTGLPGDTPGATAPPVTPQPGETETQSPEISTASSTPVPSQSPASPSPAAQIPTNPPGDRQDATSAPDLAAAPPATLLPPPGSTAAPSSAGSVTATPGGPAAGAAATGSSAPQGGGSQPAGNEPDGAPVGPWVWAAAVVVAGAGAAGGWLLVRRRQARGNADRDDETRAN